MISHERISTRRVDVDTLYFVALLRTELGNRIKTARLAARLSQRELADLIGLKNASDVSRYERGVVEVPAARIDLIAEATERPRSYFTRDPSEPPDLTFARLEALEAKVDQLPTASDVQAGFQTLQEAIDRLAKPSTAADQRVKPTRRKAVKR